MRWIKKHKLLCLILLVIIILLIVIGVSVSKAGSGSGNPVAGGSQAVTQKTTESAHGLNKFVYAIFNYEGLLQENENLKARNSELEQELLDNSLKKNDLQDLQKLSEVLNYDAVKNREVVAANITTYDGSTWINVFTIDAGSNNGIKVNDIVVSDSGLVGKVVDCGKNWSKVTSIADSSSNTSFRVEKNSKILGMVSGDGHGALKGFLLDKKKKIKKGDVLLTSGIGLFPSGIEIGTVMSVKYNEDTQLKTIKVKPSVDFTSIQKVAVII